MKKTLLLLVALITVTIAFAKTEINGIYYNLIDETKTAEVTYQYQYRDGDNYSDVTSITIPEKVTYNSTEYSVTSIGYAAFYECTSLTSITIPNNVTSIGEYAFYDCDALTSISIPNRVTSIGNVAFYGTPWLNNQPDGCLYIGKCLYQYKGEMPENTHIDVKEGTTMICGAAFYECSSLTSITIPNSVTSIGESAFSDCSSLTSISIPNSITSIGSSAFYNTPWLNNQPDGCLYIGKYLYQYKGEMPANTHINVNEGTTIICSYAFYDCSSLTSITIPNSVTEIGKGAFYSCSSLTSITIGNSVTSIGDYAFEGCSSLTSINIEATIPPTIGGAYTFINESKNIPVTVPCGSLSAYQSANYWSEFTNYVEEFPYTFSATTADATMGSVTIETAPACGVDAVIKATPKAGYTFEKWSDGNTDNPRTIVVTQDSTFTAIFEANTFVITTAVNDDTMGSVTEGGEYAYGTEIVLTATANEGYSFAQWSDGNTDNPRIITVTENKTYTAEFEVETFTITTASEVPSMGSVKVILVAEPIEGFEFVEWTDGNTDNPRTLTLTENIEVYARFQMAQGGNPVDLETSKISSANIYTTNGILHIEGATENYHILDAAGRLIYSGNASTLILPRGIYLITMGGEVEKIVL